MKNFWKKILFGIIIVFLIIPLIVIFLTSFRLIEVDTSNGWIGFWGSYLGAIIGGWCTVIGVYWTIKHTEKVRKMDIEREKENEKFSQRVSVRPYIQSYAYIQSNDTLESAIWKCFVDINDNGEVQRSYLKYPKDLFEPVDGKEKVRSGINKKFLIVNYEISNVGVGSAVNVKLTCNNGFVGVKNVLAVGERILVIFIININAIKEGMELNMIFTYDDICEMGNYSQEEIIKFGRELTELLMYAPPGLTSPKLLNE